MMWCKEDSMAWEIAKGILIAAGIIFIGIPLALVLISFLFAVVKAILEGQVHEVTVGIPAALRRRAVLKLTGNSKGWELPFTNGQAALAFGVFCMAVIIIAMYLLSIS